MSKTFQYANKHCVKLKTRFAWEKKKRIKISETSSFLVQCFFKVQARIFVQLIIFQALPSFLHKEYHSIFIPFRSQVYSKQGSPTFSLVWGIEFSIISPCLDKVFSDNWNLTNLFNIQRFPENNRWIKCVSGRVYTFLLFLTALLNCFIYSRGKVSYILHGATILVTPIKN